MPHSIVGQLYHAMSDSNRDPLPAQLPVLLAEESSVRFDAIIGYNALLDLAASPR